MLGTEPNSHWIKLTVQLSIKIPYEIKQRQWTRKTLQSERGKISRLLNSDKEAIQKEIYQIKWVENKSLIQPVVVHTKYSNCQS